MGHRPQVQLFSIDGGTTSTTDLNIEVGSLGNASFDFEGGGVDDEWTLNAHGLTVGARCQFSSVGTGAPEFLVSTDYWVAAVPTVNTFTLSASKGGAAVEGTVDSSGTWTIVRQVERFWVEGPTGDQNTSYVVARILLFLQDTGAMAAEEFGAGAALSVGLKFTVRSSADEEVFSLTPTPIKANAQWGQYAYDVTVKTWSTGDEVLLSRWTFAKFLPGDGLSLNNGERLAVEIADDLSGIGTFTLTAEGYRTDLTM